MYHHLLDKIKVLDPEIKDHLAKNTLLVVALILDEKTVNLWRLQGGVGKQLGNIEVDIRSHYQRLKRWLWSALEYPHMWVLIVKGAVSLLTKKSKLLIIDGSSWASGGVVYHFLTLSVIYQGVSVPIWWIDLDRLGQSNQWHRKLLMRTALRIFNLEGMILLGDREYIGTDWLKTLKDRLIEVVIRLRQTDYVETINQAKGKHIEKLETKAKACMGRVVYKPFELAGNTYFFVIVAYRNRSKKVEILRLISTVNPLKAVEYYRQRYKIEALFKHLKSNGFDLESLNVRYSYKVNLMMAALVLAYTLAIVYGLKYFKKKVAIKKHGSPEMSLFLWGLLQWQNHLSNIVLFLDKIAEFWHLPINSKKALLKDHVP